MSELAVETIGLSKRFGRRIALADLTLSVVRGEIFGLLGPNGAGKTTAVKALVGLVRPTGGAATVLGRPLGDRETRKRIGYLPELFRYQEWLDARDVLDVHARLLGIPTKRRADAIATGLARVGLAPRARERVGTFSKGMQQRLGLAVALLGEPDLLLLDEPTSALDPVGRHDVRKIVEAERARGATVILNSHLLSEVERVCDRIAVVDCGRVVAQGGIDEFLGVVTTVRLRLGPLTTAANAVLARFGRVRLEPPWHAIAGIAEFDVPTLVKELVANDVAIYAVENTRASLEERFLDLLRPVPDAHDRFADRR